MKYIYVGPPSSITLGKKHGGGEVILAPQALVDLPDDHPHVVRLVARKLLVLKEDGPRPVAKGKPRDKALSGSNESNETSPTSAS